MKYISPMPSQNQKVRACDAELILRAVHENCEAHKAGIKALQLHIDSNATVSGVQLKSINDHLERLNHSVADLYVKHAERGKVVDEFHDMKEEFQRRTKKVDWLRKNWWVAVLLFVGVIIIVVTILDAIGLRGLFNAVKEVKDVL